MASNDTYAGALEVLMTQIAKMKGLADADLPFLIQLETQIVGEIRSPERQMQAAGIIPQGQANPQGGAQLGLPGGGGMSAPPASFAGAGVPGAGPQMAPPSNPDELRRILQAGG